MSRLDEEEEYLTADQDVQSPFARRFEVLAELANNDRAIRKFFRGSGIGQVEIKCRRIPVDAQAIRRKLTLEGEDSAILIFARIEGRARAIIGRRVDASNPRCGTAAARRIKRTNRASVAPGTEVDDLTR